jgi:tripartite-type tricarboxylate transporter receptor subunit TctC
MKRRNFIRASIATVALVLTAGVAGAQGWPNGPIQVVVPYGAGGDTDYNARVLSQYLEAKLGVSLPVINVTGAGGSIGARRVLGAKPDGQTVLFFHTAMLANTASGVANFGFEDFEMAGIIAQEPGGLLVVRGKSPWHTVKELADAAKKKPNSISLTTNTGATTYLIGKLLQKSGVPLNFVDVGGAAGRLTAVLGGNVDVSQNPVGQVKPYLDKGELRALATVAGQRISVLPNVPTLKELGYPIQLQLEYFYLFPKGTPKAIVDKFAEAAKEVVTTNKEYAAKIKKAYFQEPHFMPPVEAVAHLKKVYKTTISSVKY